MNILEEIDGRVRNNLRPGMMCSVVLKKDQRTGRLTHGKIKRILSPGGMHPRGIKVQLTDGQVGRIVNII